MRQERIVRNERGVAFVEYCVMFAIGVAVVTLMAPYVVRAVAGRVREATQDIGAKYYLGATSTTTPNLFAIAVTRQEHVFETTNGSTVGVPSLHQPATESMFTATTTTTTPSDVSRSNVVVTTANQTITVERHETSSGVSGAPSLP